MPGGTNGVLYMAAGPLKVTICKTIELPWRNNEPQVSCIPEGKYPVKMRWSKKFGQHMSLEEVEGRSGILIHPANNALKELRGCIAPVMECTGDGRGRESRRAFQKLRNILGANLIQGPLFLNIQSK